MKKISIVVGFRDRDLERTKRFLDSLKLQTYRDFELVFIDYGSELLLSQSIKKLVGQYSFSKYIYTSTRGRVWNRSHALNTGIRNSIGDFILFSDIDLIYSSNFLEEIAKEIDPNSQIFQQVYWLPENFTDWEHLKLNQKNFNFSLDGSRGGIHLVLRSALMDINGLDEYYCFWGLEDNDLFERLKISGTTEKWMPLDNAPVYHQWHPISTNVNDNFFPPWWYEQMQVYFGLNRNRLNRNETKWGEKIEEIDREIFLREKMIDFVYPETVTLNTKGDVIKSLIDQFQNLSGNEALRIFILLKQRSPKYILGFKENLLRIIIRILNSQSTVVSDLYIKEIELRNSNNRNFIPEKDILFVVWQLIQKKEVTDYYMYYSQDKIEIRIC